MGKTPPELKAIFEKNQTFLVTTTFWVKIKLTYMIRLFFTSLIHNIFSTLPTPFLYGKMGNFVKKKPKSASRPNGVPIGSWESFKWIILETTLCLILDFPGFEFQESLNIEISRPIFHCNTVEPESQAPKLFIKNQAQKPHTSHKTWICIMFDAWKK